MSVECAICGANVRDGESLCRICKERTTGSLNISSLSGAIRVAAAVSAERRGRRAGGTSELNGQRPAAITDGRPSPQPTGDLDPSDEGPQFHDRPAAQAQRALPAPQPQSTTPPQAEPSQPGPPAHATPPPQGAPHQYAAPPQATRPPAAAPAQSQTQGRSTAAEPAPARARTGDNPLRRPYGSADAQPRLNDQRDQRPARRGRGATSTSRDPLPPVTPVDADEGLSLRRVSGGALLTLVILASMMLGILVGIHVRLNQALTVSSEAVASELVALSWVLRLPRFALICAVVVAALIADRALARHRAAMPRRLASFATFGLGCVILLVAAGPTITLNNARPTIAWLYAGCALLAIWAGETYRMVGREG